jgi:Xaa-Pro dipeptidase
MTPTNTEAQARLARARALAQHHQLDAIALVASPNMLYLTGRDFHLNERPLVLVIPHTGTPFAIVPILEVSSLRRAPFEIEMFTYNDTEGYAHGFARAAGRLAGLRIGVEGLKMRLVDAQMLQSAPDCQVIAQDSALAGLRLYKAADEVESLLRAIDISQSALEEVLPNIRIGMTERHIRAQLVQAMQERGAEGLSFSPAVLIGPNSADPHGNVGDNAVQAGQVLLIDWGAQINHYCADLTRTYALGPLDAEMARIYATVLAANQAAIAAVRPGVTAEFVDQAARAVIEAAGYGAQFTHRTGHGLGIDIHEEPNIRQGNAQVLQAGMVFTIEPGIYVEGLGGVRIEDNVLVTDDGARVLTTMDKGLRLLDI